MVRCYRCGTEMTRRTSSKGYTYWGCWKCGRTTDTVRYSEPVEYQTHYSHKAKTTTVEVGKADTDTNNRT